jgi:curved DNA-binding protein CbpA
MTDSRFDPYAVLGVARTATDEEIRAAYRVAASHAHPDREGGSTERMTDVNMAYKILSEPEMRAEFDRTGGTSQAPPLETKAREQIVGMLKLIIRASDPYQDMLEMVRTGLTGRIAGCRQARQKAYQDLSALRLRLTRLKGPPENFIETLLLQEIARGEEQMPVFDADETVMVKAFELLKDFSYGGVVALPSEPAELHRLLMGGVGRV